VARAAPGIRELVEEMSSQHCVILVLADDRYGRVFTCTDGTRLVEHLRFESTATSRDAWDADWHAGPGRVGVAVRQHFVRIAQRVIQAHRANPGAQILFGGPPEHLAVLRLELDTVIPDAPIGTVALPVTAKVGEVASVLADLMRSEEQEFQRQVVDDLLHAHRVGTAVLGLEATSEAVATGLAMLVVIETAGARTTVVDALLRRALTAGCRVQVVRADPALRRAGGVGAHLRCPP
jgi:hypothetical protein